MEEKDLSAQLDKLSKLIGHPLVQFTEEGLKIHEPKSHEFIERAEKPQK